MESPQVPQRVGNEDETKNILTTESGNREQDKIREQRAGEYSPPHAGAIPKHNQFQITTQGKDKLSANNNLAN